MEGKLGSTTSIKLCILKKCRQPLHTQSNSSVELAYCLNEKCGRYGLLTAVCGYKK